MNNINLNARKLRKNMTEQERKLWNMIKNRQFYNFRFKRQYPIGNYIVDFVCREEKIIIEIDGGQHNEGVNIEADNTRTAFLNSEGYKVIRFWNNNIDNNLTGVFEELKKVFKVE